jgi:hypothetical protein
MENTVRKPRRNKPIAHQAIRANGLENKRIERKTKEQ